MLTIVVITLGLTVLVLSDSSASRVIQGPQRFPGLTPVSQIQALHGVAPSAYKEVEEACHKLHGTIPREPNECDKKYLSALADIAYGQPGLLWIFKGYPGNKADMTDEAYHTCYAMNSTSRAVTPQPCDAMLRGLCVVAKSGCNGDEELYFDGHCFKTLGTNAYTTAEAEAECVKQGSHLASVHSEEENHAIRILVGDRYPFGKCVRLGMTYKVDVGYTHTAGSTYDRTPFDFGDRQCDTGNGYPCATRSRTALVHVTTEGTADGAFHGGHKCWDDLDDSKCSAVCKRKLQ